MLNKKLIININFNNMKYTDDRLTEEWIRNRVKIFNDYTLKSLKKQTHQDFLCHVLCDNESEQTVKKVLADYEDLPSNVKFVPIKENGIDKKAYIQDADVLLLCRIDSDDMYRYDYLERLYNLPYKKDTQAIITQKGYIYFTKENVLFDCFSESPPFYCFVYDVKDFMAGYRHKHGLGHTRIIIDLECEIIDGSNYMITNHGMNRSDSREGISKRTFSNSSGERIDNVGHILKEFC